jgi:hypothetical protein
MERLYAKKSAALARIEAKKAIAKSQLEFDELSSMLSRVSVAQNEADIDALTAQLSRLGGRKLKTLKKKGKKVRKTRKH